MLDTQGSPFDFLQTYQEMFQVRQEIESTNVLDRNNYLAFKAGDEYYLLNMAQVFEVASQINDITPLPFTSRWLLGLTSHRTDIYSVVDFKNFVGKKQSSSGIKNTASFILLHNEGKGYILKVDEVYGIRSCDVLDIQSQFPWIDGHSVMEGIDWLRINIKDLISNPIFNQNMQ